MLNKHRLYFVGCPLFGVTLEIAQRGDEPCFANPSARLFATGRSAHGERHVWIGRRVNIIWEPRNLRVGSPLLIIE